MARESHSQLRERSYVNPRTLGEFVDSTLLHVEPWASLLTLHCSMLNLGQVCWLYIAPCWTLGKFVDSTLLHVEPWASLLTLHCSMLNLGQVCWLYIAPCWTLGEFVDSTLLHVEPWASLLTLHCCSPRSSIIIDWMFVNE